MALGWRKDYLRYKGFFMDTVSVYQRKQEVKMFTEIILSAVTVAIFTVFAIRPTAITITELWKEIKAKEETIEKMDNKLQNLKKAQDLTNQEASRLSLLDTGVPILPSPEKIVRQVEGAAIQEQVSLDGVSTGEVTLVGKNRVRYAKEEIGDFPQQSQILSLNLKASGDYEVLANFLAKMEYLRRPIKINSINFIQSRSTTTPQTGINFTLSGQAPYYSLPEEEK